MFARAVLVARCKTCPEGLSRGLRVGTLGHLSWNPAPAPCFVNASGQAGPGCLEVWPRDPRSRMSHSGCGVPGGAWDAARQVFAGHALTAGINGRSRL